MVRELMLATIVSAAWLTICFMGFGALYALLGQVIGLQRLLQLEFALGRIELLGGLTSIERVSMLFYGVAMIVATLPINVYWLNRLKEKGASS